MLVRLIGDQSSLNRKELVMKRPIMHVFPIGLALLLVLGGRTLAASDNGRAGTMPAYYDGELLGYRKTQLEAQALADQHAYDLLRRGSATPAAELERVQL